MNKMAMDLGRQIGGNIKQAGIGQLLGRLAGGAARGVGGVARGVGRTIAKHPYATAATVGGGGAYQMAIKPFLDFLNRTFTASGQAAEHTQGAARTDLSRQTQQNPW